MSPSPAQAPADRSPRAEGAELPGEMCGPAPVLVFRCGAGRAHRSYACGAAGQKAASGILTPWRCRTGLGAPSSESEGLGGALNCLKILSGD